MATVQALPIDAYLPEALARLERDGRLVLVAEPGAGKTTRLPRALLEAEVARQGEILVLEPRRLAARLSAMRVADELSEPLGERVGYQVRFERRASARTRLLFMTEALLMRRLASDPLLEGVSAVVFDEFHERSLDADLGLALVKRAQASRPGLRLVVMSATLDARALEAYLETPRLEVPGRAYPVDVEHLERPDDRRLEVQVGAAVRRMVREVPTGDVLVFLPGAAEIRRAEEACAETAARERLELVMLHGDMPAAEQDRALRPGARRKVILATNVAETSITLPAVTAVIDSGLRREARHSPWTGLPTLTTSKVSQASATQRAGRAGRVGPGRCLRLYTRHDLITRPAHDDPEIRRADLAGAMLTLAAAGHDPASFPYFEAPAPAAIEAGKALLAHLGAFDSGLTPLGRRMATLPLHPRLARVALEAASRGAAARGCLAVALLGEREIRLSARARWGARREPIDTEVGSSDVIARIEAFEEAEAEGLSARVLRQLELDPMATRAVQKARDQLTRALRVDRAPERSLEDEEEALAMALLTGYPDRVGRRRTKRSDEVVFAGGGSGKLEETSVVREAELLVALDAGERAGRRVIRMASAIEPEWLLELFPDRIEDRRELGFDPSLEQVVEVSEVLYGGLSLDRSVRRDATGPEVAARLAEAALDLGVDRIWDADAREALARRLAFAASHGLGVRPLDEALLREAVTALAEGARGLADLRARSLIDAVLALEPPDALARMRAFAPETVAIPGRPRVPVRYEADRPPFIESRLQDFFGAAEGPTIAGGKVPLLLHLLAPNQRAVQVTTDLAGFWERHYPSIKKELMRRYPRHAWPDDPRSATPSKPAKRRRD